MVDKVEEYRETLIESALEHDDEAMMAYLEDGKEPEMDTIKACIKRGTINLDFFPTLLRFCFQEQRHSASVECCCGLPAKPN